MGVYDCRPERELRGHGKKQLALIFSTMGEDRLSSFEELAASRREWIANVLQPWCLQASRKELRKAEDEWMDIAGKVDADATLWTWAWSRFPLLVHEGLTGVDETYPVRVTLTDGRSAVGFPDGQQSVQGQLVLQEIGTDNPRYWGPISIDEIITIERVEP